MTLEKQIIPDSQDVEVTAKMPRRRFSADEKRRIVQAADACKQPGELTALLRKEGIYWTYLTNWRKAFKKNGLAPGKRGRKPKAPETKLAENQANDLRRQLTKALARAERAEALVDLQKKVAALLSSPVNSEEE